jgi:hypothetical protein
MKKVSFNLNNISGNYYIFDPENEQKVPINSKVGKKVIQNYNNKLKNKPIKSVKKFYNKFSIVDIDESLISDWFADISILYFLLEQITSFKTVNNRSVLNVNEGKRLRSMHLGLKSWQGVYKECVSNERHPEIYNLIMDMKLKYFPRFQFNQILVNKNQPFKKHKDGNNLKSDTLIFSIGDYTGDLHIEDQEINTNCRPIIFNGKELEHSVPGPIIGTRYSILFYMI